MSARTGRVGAYALVVFGAVFQAPPLAAQAAAPRRAISAPALRAQPNDSAYTAQIKQYLSDPRISTELVDHLPASVTVPTPLKYLGHIIGAPGVIDHTAQIYGYLRAVAKATPRAKVWSIGKTEENHEMIMMAIADSATIANLDRYRGYLRELTDPRTTSEARAQQLLHTAKPIYWITSGMHSTETGGPEMLMELAYRLTVENTPLIRNIRDSIIVFITPVVEPIGRDRVVDAYNYNKKYGATRGRMNLPYWGDYVEHDDNRDGMGQMLPLTKNITRAMLDWTPQVMHDLHESVTYLYVSTGTGPYNEALDPITVNEWWLLAENDILEMTKRGVPGVWTYNYYDGWVPNYMFFIAHTHNAIGRFYEVQSYTDTNWVTPGAGTLSREWYRPNPPLPRLKWSPRANTNIQESAILFALNRFAHDRRMFLEDYWIKNRNAVDRGRHGPIYGWVIPARQHSAENAAEAVNDLRAQGLEFHRATSDYIAGTTHIAAGDYIIRGDQPYQTLAAMYFALQNFAPDNPSPYDDTGWTFPLMRDLTVLGVTDSSLFHAPMTAISTDVHAGGGVMGKGRTVIVANNHDNRLVEFRFRFPKVAMQAAEAPFAAGGHRFGAGALIVSNPPAAADSVLAALGLSGWAVNEPPAVATHALTTPRIGFVHSWTRTQDEGWVRGALDYYHVPYVYFGEPLLKQGHLRDKYDVIIYPTGGSGIRTATFGRGGNGSDTTPPPPVPYKRTAEFPSFGTPDSTDNLRDTAGPEGMKALYEFVQQGGTLITEGGTVSIFPDLDLTPGIRVESTARTGLFARGTIVRGLIVDSTSPLVYGYQYDQVPVYFSNGPVLTTEPAPPPTDSSATGAAGFGFGTPRGPTMTPMAAPNRLRLSPWDPAGTGRGYGEVQAAADSTARNGARGGGGGFGGGFFGRGGAGRGGGAPPRLDGVVAGPNASTRVVMQFPDSAADMLLSGTLANGQVLSHRAQLVDESIGRGHIVMFAFRPFWRWQTQGTFAMGFNAIMNWDHLDAGRR